MRQHRIGGRILFEHSAGQNALKSARSSRERATARATQSDDTITSRKGSLASRSCVAALTISFFHCSRKSSRLWSFRLCAEKVAPYAVCHTPHVVAIPLLVKVDDCG